MSSSTTYLTEDKLHRALASTGMEPLAGLNPEHEYDSPDPSQVGEAVSVLHLNCYLFDRTYPVRDSKFALRFRSPSNAHPYPVTLLLKTDGNRPPQLAMVFYNEHRQLERFIATVSPHYIIESAPSAFGMHSWKLAQSFKKRYPSRDYFWVPERILSELPLSL